MFVLMTLFAMACSWYAYEMNEAAKRRAAIAKIEKLGGLVWYYDASDPLVIRGEPPAWYSWLRKLHGDQHLGNPVGVDLHFVSSQDTDTGLELVKRLTNLQMLHIDDDTQVSDEDIKNIQEALPNCKIHYVYDTSPPPLVG